MLGFHPADRKMPSRRQDSGRSPSTSPRGICSTGGPDAVSKMHGDHGRAHYT